MWSCPYCSRSYSHQSSFSRHVHGNPVSGHKPCCKIKGTKQVEPVYTVKLVPHQCTDRFPEFVSQSSINEILNTKWPEDIPSQMLKLIHLSPGNDQARPYCNIYWPNTNKNTIAYFDGNDWLFKHFDTWFLGWWAWIYRCWKTVPNRSIDKDTSFMVILANRDKDKRWESAKRLTKHAFLSSGTRSVIKKMHEVP